jgi:hypothetical protein
MRRSSKARSSTVIAREAKQSNDPGTLSIHDREMKARLAAVAAGGDDNADSSQFARAQKSRFVVRGVDPGPRQMPSAAKPAIRPENAPPSALAKARTERVERRTSESGDLQNPAPADCPDIRLTY